MLGGFLKSRSAQREIERSNQTEAIKAKLSPFGDNSTENPIRDQIADLRALRNAGTMSENDYAAKVADLLGTSDSVIG